MYVDQFDMQQILSKVCIYRYIYIYIFQEYKLPAQTSGSPLTIQPYLKAKASVNSCLLSEKPFALIGKADNQFESPTSCANVSFRFI